MAASSYTATLGPAAAGGTSISSDADFRAFGSGLSTLLAAMGLVQTADTGQINWTTVTRPGVQNTAAGYEIWRFNDTLQATAPVYLKLEWGIGPGNGGYLQAMSMWVTIGTGSNGTGSLTGQVGGRRQFSQYGDASSPGVMTGATHYVSAANNRLCAAFAPAYGSGAKSAFGFSVERAKDATGADDGTGVFRHVWGFTTGGATTFAGSAHQFLPFPTGSAGGEDVAPPVASHGQGSAVAGADVGVFPVFPAWGILKNPSTNLIVYKTSDIGALATISVPLYGTNRTYLPLGGGANQLAAGPRALTNEALMMRYE